MAAILYLLLSALLILPTPSLGRVIEGKDPGGNFYLLVQDGDQLGKAGIIWPLDGERTKETGEQDLPFPKTKKTLAQFYPPCPSSSTSFSSLFSPSQHPLLALPLMKKTEGGIFPLNSMAENNSVMKYGLGERIKGPSDDDKRPRLEDLNDILFYLGTYKSEGENEVSESYVFDTNCETDEVKNQDTTFGNTWSSVLDLVLSRQLIQK